MSELVDWSELLKPLFGNNSQLEDVDHTTFGRELSRVLHPDIGKSYMRLTEEKQKGFIKDLWDLTQLDINNANPDDLRKIYANLAQRSDEFFTWAEDPDPSW